MFIVSMYKLCMHIRIKGSLNIMIPVRGMSNNPYNCFYIAAATLYLFETDLFRKDVPNSIV